MKTRANSGNKVCVAVNGDLMKKKTYGNIKDAIIPLNAILEQCRLVII